MRDTMNYDEILHILKGAIAEMFDEDEESITPDTLFIDDLYADEFDAEELMMIAEEEFGIGPLTKKSIKNIESVDDAVKFILKEMK